MDDDELEDVVDVIDVVGGVEIVEELNVELEELKDDVGVVVDTAVLIQEQPLDILEGKLEHAVAQAGRVPEALSDL